MVWGTRGSSFSTFFLHHPSNHSSTYCTSQQTQQKILAFEYQDGHFIEGIKLHSTLHSTQIKYVNILVTDSMNGQILLTTHAERLIARSVPKVAIAPDPIVLLYVMNLSGNRFQLWLNVHQCMVVSSCMSACTQSSQWFRTVRPQYMLLCIRMLYSKQKGSRGMPAG